LFSGIGGIDLATEWAGFTTVGQCEFADYPTKVLEKHWPNVPRWRDIRSVTADSFRAKTGLQTVDLISGGFPCQPFSVAGKQKGKRDDRYLWPEMLRVIREIKPTWVLGENVPGILRIAGRTVCEDLEREGYAVTVFNFEAAAVGAPHRRDRVFFVAHSRRPLRQGGVIRREDGNETRNGTANITERPSCTPSFVADTESRKSGKQESRNRREGIGRGSEKVIDVADTNNERLERWDGEVLSECTGQFIIGKGSTPVANTDVCNPASQGFQDRANQEMGRSEQEPQPERPNRWAVEPNVGGMASRLPCWLDGYWRVEPNIPRVATGVKNRVDRLKCLGNAVVPQQIYPILRAIAEIEEVLQCNSRQK
jgi:DNA (cytosine-5)-methyltransferase 1